MVVKLAVLRAVQQSLINQFYLDSICSDENIRHSCSQQCNMLIHTLLFKIDISLQKKKKKFIIGKNQSYKCINWAKKTISLLFCMALDSRRLCSCKTLKSAP